MILPDFDNNPNTMDILLMDNGQSKSFGEERATPAEDNYSRGVQFRIDTKAKTVQQIWEYGKERGGNCYATFLGDADYMYKTRNRLLCFGGQLRVGGVAVDDILSGVMGDTATNSRIVEVRETGGIVFEVAVHENAYSSSAETYQAERMELYSADSFSYELGEIAGQRLGRNDNNEIDEAVSAPTLYAGEIGVNFNRIGNENGRLIIDGSVNYRGKTYLLGRADIVLRSADNVYVFTTYNALNGRFFASIDTTDLESDVYQISIAGAVREGNDALNGTLYKGHTLTEYKITVP